MSLNPHLEEMLGKTISAVVAKGGSRQLLFLVFSDGTYMELYGTDVHNANGVRSGGLQDALNYLPDLTVIRRYSNEQRVGK